MLSKHFLCHLPSNSFEFFSSQKPFLHPLNPQNTPIPGLWGAEHIRSEEGFQRGKEQVPDTGLGISVSWPSLSIFPPGTQTSQAQEVPLIQVSLSPTGHLHMFTKAPLPPPIPLFFFRIAQVWTQILFSSWANVTEYYETEGRGRQDN